MYFTSFINYIDPKGTLPEHLTNDLHNRCEAFDMPANTMLMEHGQPAKFIYFIHDGLLRTFRFGEGKQHTTRFSGANEFIADGQGFLNKTLSEIAVISHSQTSGIKIRTHDWNILCEDNAIFMELTRNILIQQYLKAERQSVVYRTGDLKKKLLHLCSLFPGITDKVARKHIGNFFGTSEQGISNILSDWRKSH